MCVYELCLHDQPIWVGCAYTYMTVRNLVTENTSLLSCVMACQSLKHMRKNTRQEFLVNKFVIMRDSSQKKEKRHSNIRYIMLSTYWLDGVLSLSFTCYDVSTWRSHFMWFSRLRNYLSESQVCERKLHDQRRSWNLTWTLVLVRPPNDRYLP